MAHLRPRVTAVPAPPDVPRRRPQDQHLPARIDVERVTVDDVIALAGGRPPSSVANVFPSVVLVTTNRPSVGTRQLSSAAGTNHAVSGRRGWTATANPNGDGRNILHLNPIASRVVRTENPVVVLDPHIRSGAAGQATRQAGPGQ